MTFLGRWRVAFLLPPILALASALPLGGCSWWKTPDTALVDESTQEATAEYRRLQEFINDLENQDGFSN